MNTRAFEILNSEQEKNRYYDSAEELLKAAGLKNIHVDRTQLSIVPHGSCGRLMIRVAVEKFNKRTVKTSELKALEKVSGYKSVYDRYKRVKSFEMRPIYEWGYIELPEKIDNGQNRCSVV